MSNYKLIKNKSTDTGTYTLMDIMAEAINGTAYAIYSRKGWNYFEDAVFLNDTLNLLSVTTTERDALIKQDGTLIYNSTTRQIEFWSIDDWYSSGGGSGLPGPAGGDSEYYTFSTSIVDANPGVGKVRLDSTDYTLVTRIFVSKTNRYSIDIEPWLDTLDDSTNIPKSYVRILKEGDPTVFVLYKVMDVNIDATGYLKLVVEYVYSNDNFLLNDDIILTITRLGDYQTADMDTLIYTGSNVATRQVGGTNIGDVIFGLTLKNLLKQTFSPYTAPSISLLSLSPSSSNYNQQNVSYTVSFRWIKNTGTPDLVSAQIQYRRGGSGSWTTFTTSLSGSSGSTPRDASLTSALTVNTGGPDNSSVDFRCLFTDADQTRTSSTASGTFVGYVAPTASLGLTPTPSLTSSKMIRSISTTTSVIISGTISRNSPNINLSEYKVQRDYSDNSWIDLISYTSIASGGGTLASYGGNITDTTQPTNKTSIRFRAMVKDTEVPGGQAVNSITGFNIYTPVFTGMTTNVIGDIAGLSNDDFKTLLSGLTVVPNGTSSGQVNYSNGSSDKAINGLSFAASTNRFCVVYASGYGTLTTFFDSGSNLNLISNFSSTTKDLTFPDGTTTTLRIYIYNLVVSSGTYLININ